MSISGTITLCDIRIDFEAIYPQDGADYVNVRITSDEEGSEEYQAVQHEFFAALAIAVHNDGTPDWQVDYPKAENAVRRIRWIP